MLAAAFEKKAFVLQRSSFSPRAHASVLAFLRERANVVPHNTPPPIRKLGSLFTIPSTPSFFWWGRQGPLRRPPPFPAFLPDTAHLRAFIGARAVDPPFSLSWGLGFDGGIVSTKTSSFVSTAVPFKVSKTFSPIWIPCSFFLAAI